MTVKVHSTVNCPNSTRILFALEELELPYTIETVEDGRFSREWGSPGPTISDGEVTTIEPGAILRHLARRTGKLWPTRLADQAEADRLFEFQGRRMTRAIENKDPAEVQRLFALIENRLADRTWFLDEFTMVDVYYSIFVTARARFPFVEQLPSVCAFIDRISARPTFARAQSRVP